jgi:hypothetical protein
MNNSYMLPQEKVRNIGGMTLELEYSSDSTCPKFTSSQGNAILLERAELKSYRAT